ncbi:CoA-binding protein [Nocardioides glacieisoli]|uniref:CoA-binding protein n=1 Tax=Nocardioides glacieisoli TaxID=1168730 RepID=A0A4Q2RR57_9ACTN|nr:CoA-binding protein [Nocardioides glacieisoli]RYB91461.1 CoA-binding protein [Nocardioides glacieisoli]
MATPTTSTEQSWQDPETVDALLRAETWAVVGLSGDPTRTAYAIASLLQERGKRVVPIHPMFAEPDAPQVLGEKGYAALADVPFDIDVVDVFRRSEAAGEFADQAVQVGAGGVWFQLGVIDEDAFARTRAAGVPMVMDTCPAIEWRKR